MKKVAFASLVMLSLVAGCNTGGTVTVVPPTLTAGMTALIASAARFEDPGVLLNTTAIVSAADLDGCWGRTVSANEHELFHFQAASGRAVYENYTVDPATSSYALVVGAGTVTVETGSLVTVVLNAWQQNNAETGALEPAERPAATFSFRGDRTGTQLRLVKSSNAAGDTTGAVIFTAFTCSE